MRTTTKRRSKIPKEERILALDELLPKKSGYYYDSSPGVYVRQDRDRELDVLWEGYGPTAREDRSPMVYLGTGFIAGIVSVLVMTAILNFGRPADSNMSSELDLWAEANTRPAPVVNVSPSEDSRVSSVPTTAEYRVRSGDTLERIAYRFYGSGSPSKVDKIQVANNLKNPHEIRIGQKLVIPVEE